MVSSDHDYIVEVVHAGPFQSIVKTILHSDDGKIRQKVEFKEINTNLEDLKQYIPIGQGLLL